MVALLFKRPSIKKSRKKQKNSRNQEALISALPGLAARSQWMDEKMKKMLVSVWRKEMEVMLGEMEVVVVVCVSGGSSSGGTFLDGW